MPGAFEAHYNRGNVLADFARFEETLASYEKAFEIKTDAAPIFNNRGLVLEQLSRFNEALASYDEGAAAQSELPRSSRQPSPAAAGTRSDTCTTRDEEVGEIVSPKAGVPSTPLAISPGDHGYTSDLAEHRWVRLRSLELD